MDTHVYRIGDSLYVNLTNRCSNRCTFCVRNGKEEYEGYALWLKEGEPSAETVIEKIGDPAKYRETVFCGFGEPTYRLNEMLKICDYVHAGGGKTRLNTNGHGNALHGKDITPLLKGKIDGVNISLNAPDARLYGEVCKPQIEGAFEAMLSFAQCCKRAGLNCWFSVVDCIGRDQVEACKKLADAAEIPLRVRETIE
jgi:TatD family-associated radical SAM protein